MVSNKSLDEVEIIAALLCDAHASNGVVFNTRSLTLTLKKVIARYRSEGVGFLTKTLPRLGKHFDQVLAGAATMNAVEVGFQPLPNSKLPRFLGEFFIMVLQHDGSLLPDPDANCVKIIRMILYLFYKYELPYKDEQEQEVLSAFKQAELDLSDVPPRLAALRDGLYDNRRSRSYKRFGSQGDSPCDPNSDVYLRSVIQEARTALNKLFWAFDPLDINPRHGPGVVATKQRLSEKFRWTNVSSRITSMYPFDAYFCASLGHVCDSFSNFSEVTDADLPARVLLVPKDSRGPRLISCEPVDFQWIQQGLRQAIYRTVENHELTKFNVFFTDQGPNQRGALLGSSTGRYATLDLKEASDRVHLELVRLLFPDKLTPYLEACRSSSTVLPCGTVLGLQKFAPMGSALCFPIMALTIWSLLYAAAPNADTRESILVYGDDVIVPTAYAESAMAILEAFGLKINRAKSCIHGLFRESCGVDAFKGANVTPVRIRTVWNESPRPDVYTSWIAYANSFWDRRCYYTYEYIVSRLTAIYGPIPGDDMFEPLGRGCQVSQDPDSFESKPCPSLRVASAEHSMFRRRYNKNLQKIQYYVRDVHSPSVDQAIDGWSMLLRYFSETQNPPDLLADRHSGARRLNVATAFSVSRYTNRHASKLVRRWR